MNEYEYIASEINEIGRSMGYTKKVKKGDIGILLHPIGYLPRNKLNNLFRSFDRTISYAGSFGTITKSKMDLINIHYSTVFKKLRLNELDNIGLYARLFSIILIPGCSKSTVVELMTIFALMVDR